MRRKGELSREGVAILSGKRLEFDMSRVRGEIGPSGYGWSVHGAGLVRREKIESELWLPRSLRKRKQPCFDSGVSIGEEARKVRVRLLLRDNIICYNEKNDSK